MTQLLRRRDRLAREREEESLSLLATRAAASRGRRVHEEEDPYRTCFERDRDRIVHSKAFRRLKRKAQVFINPKGDHTITRLTHTLQVAQVARALAAGLGLNEPLAEAVALGHDVGHTPFGHVGEEALSVYFPQGWQHSQQSLRIYDVLEDVNLTWEVRDGIERHPWKVEPGPSTPEADCVRLADRIAYLTHDVLDALRVGMLTTDDLPTAVRRVLGPPGSGWIGTLIHGVFDHSVRVGEVALDPELLPVMHELREFMFARVYNSPEQKSYAAAGIRVLRQLFEHLRAHPEEIPATYLDADADVDRQVADYVAGMTDRYALDLHHRWFEPVLFDHPARTL